MMLLFAAVCYSVVVLVTTFVFTVVGLLVGFVGVVLAMWWFVGGCDCCLLFGCLRL